MDHTFTNLAVSLVTNPHASRRIRISYVMVELLETSVTERHPIEILLRNQLISLISACINHPLPANAHSLLEIVAFYDKHFIIVEETLTLAA